MVGRDLVADLDQVAFCVNGPFYKDFGEFGGDLTGKLSISRKFDDGAIAGHGNHITKLICAEDGDRLS